MSSETLRAEQSVSQPRRHPLKTRIQTCRDAIWRRVWVDLVFQMLSEYFVMSCVPLRFV